MLDTSGFDFSYTPDLTLEDNAGRFFTMDDDDELVEYDGARLQPGTGADGKTRIHYHDEHDIAFHAMESSLSDVVWVTMHRDGDDYRLVFRSEVEDYDENQLPDPVFKHVPSFGELIHALDSVPKDHWYGDVDGWFQTTIFGVTISDAGSEYYPQLDDWYMAVQDHFFETGDFAYLDDAEGKNIRFVHAADPAPHRRAETVPGSGSFFAAAQRDPNLISTMFGKTDGEGSSQTGESGDS